MSNEDYRMIKWVSSRHPHSPYSSETGIQPDSNLKMFLGVTPWIIAIAMVVLYTM